MEKKVEKEDYQGYFSSALKTKYHDFSSGRHLNLNHVSRIVDNHLLIRYRYLLY